MLVQLIVFKRGFDVKSILQHPYEICRSSFNLHVIMTRFGWRLTFSEAKVVIPSKKGKQEHVKSTNNIKKNMIEMSTKRVG